MQSILLLFTGQAASAPGKVQKEGQVQAAPPRDQAGNTGPARHRDVLAPDNKNATLEREDEYHG